VFSTITSLSVNGGKPHDVLHPDTTKSDWEFWGKWNRHLTKRYTIVKKKVRFKMEGTNRPALQSAVGGGRGEGGERWDPSYKPGGVGTIKWVQKQKRSPIKTNSLR